jgi:hypothetical protein
LKTQADGSVVAAIAGVDYAAAGASTGIFEVDGRLGSDHHHHTSFTERFVSRASSTVVGNLAIAGNTPLSMQPPPTPPVLSSSIIN